VIVINQPTFLPWIGWFDLVDQSDKFVFLDDVQFSRQSWQQRNRICASGAELFITVPVVHKKNIKLKINEAEISNPSFFTKKFIKTIRTYYSRSPYFDDYFEIIYDQLSNVGDGITVADLNIAIIKVIFYALGINKKIFRSSGLCADGAKSSYLTSIIEELCEKEYLSPYGAHEYLREDREVFLDKKIKVFLHNYSHPIYRQVNKGEFLPYLSIVDLLFNEGPKSMGIIRSGRKECLRLI